jgi:hypothetical protein
MVNQEPNLDAADLSNLSVEQRIAAWADLLDACDQFLLAGLRREVGPTGSVETAYRNWYAEHMKEHDQMMRHMMEALERRSGQHAR